MTVVDSAEAARCGNGAASSSASGMEAGDNVGSISTAGPIDSATAGSSPSDALALTLEFKMDLEPDLAASCPAGPQGILEEEQHGITKHTRIFKVKKWGTKRHSVP